MIEPRRTLGLALALAALATPALAQDIQSLYREGVEALERGRKEEALAKFQAILAADPSDEDAYELWRTADHQVFVDMMVEGGEYRLVAQRFLERARLGRKARVNDEDAIREIVDALYATPDAAQRRNLVAALDAEHGEYAAPFLVPALADSADDDRRVVAMTTLIDLSGSVVPALVEAMGSGDPFQRRNVAIVLGRIGDPRAAGPLEAVAATDTENQVVRAAKEAAARCGSQGDAVTRLLSDGDDYHHRRSNVLRPFDDSEVIWNWESGKLVSSPVPRIIYCDEMSKKAYYRALALAPDSLEAQAGLARAAVDEQAKLAMLEAAGGDAGDLADKAAEGALTVAAAGVDALDMALLWSVKSDDVVSGSRLCAALSTMAAAPTPGLLAALDATDPNLRGEAAVALAHIAVHSSTSASGNVVAALGEAVGREVVRIAALVDGNAERAAGIIAALTEQGVLVNHRGSGGEGILMLRRVPGVDVVLVGDRVASLTSDAVLAEVAKNPNLAETPVFFVTDNEELADAYSDRVAGVVPGAADLSALDEVFEASLTGDRAQADDLAARAAGSLAQLSIAGHTDVAGTADALASTLAHRQDAVTLPAMLALGSCGTWQQAESLLGVLSDGERSDEARVAAADALGSISVHGASADAAAPLAEVIRSDASLAVRSAAARALGRLPLDGATRAELLRGVRVQVSE